MKKKISAAIIFTDGIKFLIVNPTNKNYWETPKGEIDDNENPKETAVREFKEEVGYTLNINNLKYVGKYELHKMKDIILFIYKINILPPISKFKCVSTTKAYGAPVPEISAYKYISYNDLSLIRSGLIKPINDVKKILLGEKDSD